MTPAAQSSSSLPEEHLPEQIVHTEPGSQEIEYAPAAMETVRTETITGLMKLSRGGIEVGGVLFGRNTPEAVRILAARPFPCEHRFGPSFVLSDKDEDAFREMLDNRDDETRDLEPVGWYVSHCRRKFSLEESDIRIFDRYFPKAGSVTLIVMPEKIKPSRACFFIRDPEAKVKPDVPSCEVQLPSALDVPIAVPQPKPEPSLALTPHVPHSPSRPLAPVPFPLPPLDNREIAARRLQTFLNQQEKHRRISRWNLWATLAVLLLCMAGAGYLWMRANSSDAPAIPLHVSDSGAQIRIEWDAKLRSVQSASSGVLEMREADGTSENLILQPNALRIGSAFYTRHTDKVEVHLKLLYPDRPAFESVVYFIHPVNVAANAPATQTPAAQAPAATPAEPEPAPPDAAPASKEPDKTAKESDKTPDTKPAQKPRTFRPPPAISTQRPVTTTAANIPSAPLLAPNTAVPIQPPTVNLPLANAPVIAPPPAPAPTPARTETTARAEPPRPRSGRLVWTGDLARNALLTISPNGSSLGWANGRLPGFPVRISVHVAELVAGGIEVYSEDSHLPNPEAPNAQNGWNTVVYKADPKKVGADVRVIEAPSPSNSWTQIVLRNGKHAVSVLVVDWVRVQ